MTRGCAVVVIVALMVVLVITLIWEEDDALINGDPSTSAQHLSNHSNSTYSNTTWISSGVSLRSYTKKRSESPQKVRFDGNSSPWEEDQQLSVNRSIHLFRQSNSASKQSNNAYAENSLHVESQNQSGTKEAVFAYDILYESMSKTNATYAGHSLWLNWGRLPPSSSVHCIAENFRANSLFYRSCQYRNLCLDTKTGAFVVHSSPAHRKVTNHVTVDDGVYFLSSVPKAVIAGALTVDRLKKGIGRWSPEDRNVTDAPISQYWLPEDIVLIPMFPWKACGTGNFLWDVVLPIYSLLEIFEMQNKTILVTEVSRRKLDCSHSIKNYEGLAGFHIYQARELGIVGDNATLLCSRFSVNGIGYFMTHGPPPDLRDMHDKARANFAPHNLRRSVILQNFRNFLLKNIKVSFDGPRRSNLVTFVVSEKIEDGIAKLIGLVRQIELARVQILHVSNTTVEEQIQVASMSSVMVTKGGPSSIPALFLPRDASLLLLGTADWDLWSNYASLRVHFIPESESNVTSRLFADLILAELSTTNYTQPAPDKSLTNEETASFMNRTTLTFVKGAPPPSQVHCIGDNMRKNGWIFRSCHYKGLCFDLRKKSFVLFFSESTLRLHQTAQTVGALLSSAPQKVVNGGQVRNQLLAGKKSWNPEVRPLENLTSYYTLPANTIWISFHPHENCNYGHQLWDSILPIFALLDMFQLDGLKLLLTETGMKDDCSETVMQLLNLDQPLVRNDEIELEGAKSDLVCSHNSVNGMSGLTDHIVNGHGKSSDDFTNPVNVGRGPELMRFRNYLLKGWDLPINSQPTKLVIFSILSSRAPNRRTDFKYQAVRVRDKLPEVQVECVATWNYTLEEQARIVSQAGVFVSIVGGGTAPAFWLPKGAALILYGDQSNMLDWDLWNNFANIRVHWLSMPRRDNDTDLLVDLIADELGLLGAAS